MFEFIDPAGRDFLGNAAAMSNYQERMSSFYDRFAALNDSAFSFIEAFDELEDGQQPPYAAHGGMKFECAVRRLRELYGDSLAG